MTADKQVSNNHGEVVYNTAQYVLICDSVFTRDENHCGSVTEVFSRLMSRFSIA